MKQSESINKQDIKYLCTSAFSGKIARTKSTRKRHNDPDLDLKS